MTIDDFHSNRINQKSADNSMSNLPNAISDPCVHCGFCLPTCASYRVLGTEMDSPRGRIHTLKAIKQEELVMDKVIASHFDTCLGCFACVTACPSGVRYDQLLEETRPLLNDNKLRNPCQSIIRKLLLNFLPYPNRLRRILQALRFYPGSTLQETIRRLGISNILGPQIEAMEALLPPLTSKNFNDNWKVYNPAKGKYRGKVGLVLGCVQRCFDPDVNQAVLSVLVANGFDVVIPNNQGCCGAVSHHQGQINQTEELANALIKSFNSAIGPNKPGGDQQLDAILVAASGCGHTMKSYGKTINLKDKLKTSVLDVHEFLIDKGLSKEFKASLGELSYLDDSNEKNENIVEIAYHDACHMLHGQDIFMEPRELLNLIPNIVINEAKEAGVCCGSAGIYNIVQPEEANELGKIKAQDLTDTGAKLIASANIGCTLQLRKHLNKKVKVAHPLQILACAAGLHDFPGLIQSRLVPQISREGENW